MKTKLLSIMSAGIICTALSAPLFAEPTAQEQVQQIVTAMQADGITAAEIQAAVQGNPTLAAQIIAAAAQAVPAAERAAIISAGLNAVPADQVNAVANAVYNSVPDAMRGDVIAGSVAAGLDPAAITEATAAGPGPADAGAGD
ncbi:MAG: hypothetical protein GY814_14460, partial [Gammaproteobacteria bacterium]|nr:hypothetical protein [Gammaproteobacteria bacterium]